MKGQLARRTASVAAAAVLLAGTGVLGRVLIGDEHKPVVAGWPASVARPAPWAVPPPGPLTQTRRSTMQVETPTGVRDAVLVQPVAPGPAQPTGVVLLSGSGARGPEAMVPWAEALAAQGIPCITLAKPDGYSPVSRDFEELAADARAAAAALSSAAQVDEGRVHVAGLSEGGWVAVLAAGPPASPFATAVTLSGPTVKPGEQILWMSHDGLPAGWAGEGPRAAVTHALSLPVPGMDFARFDAVGALDRLERPLLAVYGADDGTVPVGDAASLVVGHHPHGSGVVIAPGLGHPLTRDGEVDPQVVSAVAAWVQGEDRPVAVVQGVPPRRSAPTQQLVEVPGWHGALLVSANVLALGGWLANRIGRRARGRSGAGPADRLADAALVSVLVNHAGLGALVGLGIAHAPDWASAIPWLAMKAAAVLLALRAADTAVTGLPPRSGRAIAGCLAGLGGLAGVAFAGATRSWW